MIEYLTINEAKYLADLVLGLCPADYLSNDARIVLQAKLWRMADWALREDAARERIRSMA